MRRRALATSLLVLALLAAACTSTQPSSPTTVPTQPSTPIYSDTGTVTVAVQALPTNFNPSAPAGGNRITQEVMEQVWPQAFVTNTRDDETLEPGFVESAEAVSVSPLTINYTLNPEAKWSDGVPITTADFIYNWHEQLVYASLLPDAGLVAGYRDISAILSSNHGHTATVKFNHPFAEWEALFSNLVPAHIGETYGWVSAFQGFDPLKVISGGPFEITSVVPDKELVLSRNPTYWATKPSLSHIILKVMSTSSALAGLETGAVSVAEAPEGPQDTNVLAGAARAGWALSREDSTLPTLWQLCVNMTSPVLQPTGVRLGIEDSLFLAQISTDSAGLDDAFLGPDYDRLTLGEQPGTGEVHPEPWDPTAALTYFGSFGLAQGSDGYLRPGGLGPPITLSLVIPSGYLVIHQAAEVIQAELQEVGVRVVIHGVRLSTLLGRTMPEGNYELAIAPFLLTTFAAGEAAVYSIPVLPASVSASGSTTAARTSSGGGSFVAGPAGGGGAGDSDGASASSTSTSTTPTTTSTTLPTVSNPALPWSAPTPVGTEPDATVAGVITRDVFGLSNPAVSHDFEGALTDLNTDQAALYLSDADTMMWQDVPTLPLFQQPIAVIHESELMNVAESPTWAGVFWNAEDWAIQLSPPIPPPTFPGVTPPSTSTGVSGVTTAVAGGRRLSSAEGTGPILDARVSRVR